MKMFNMFGAKEKDVKAIPFSFAEERVSPFAIYDGEEAILERVWPTSFAEYQFLMNLEAYSNDTVVEIIKIIGSIGVVTSRQIAQLLQRKSAFSVITQKDVQRYLSKLCNKNFIGRVQFHCGNHKSSYSSYILGYYGRKILIDMDLLPENSLYFKRTPAYKIKGILASTQVLIENGLYDYVLKRSTLLNFKENFTRIDGILEINDSIYILEPVRKTVCESGEYTHRVEKLEEIVKDYMAFGFTKKPKLLVIAESSLEANAVRKFTHKLEKYTDVIYTFDTANMTNLIDANGNQLVA